jgi:hypothetical protein
MIQEAAKQSYRGVLCMSCRQPIPLPAIVLSLLPPRGSPGPDSERVFTLRCRACGRERPYRSADIIVLDGTPRPRVSYVRSPRGVRGQQSGLSWAASG